jgi:RHS repeat-associated protein
VALNAYDEYGVPASTNQGRFGYTGQVWLPEVGLNYYKARMYAPTLGRFMQTDPIGYGDGVNWYDYVGGDPVNGTDPSGMESQLICRSVYGAGNHCFVVITNKKKQITDRFSYGPEKETCATCDKGKLVETRSDRDSATNRADSDSARTGKNVTSRTNLNQFGVKDDQVRKAGQAMDAKLGSILKPGDTKYSLWSSSSNTAAAGLLDVAQPGLSGKVELGSGITPGWPIGGALKPNQALDDYNQCVRSGGCK